MPVLNARSLHELDPAVAVPSYDRGEVTAGIVHFGVGGFHRAHQAYYADRLLEAGHDPSWGLCGVGVLPADARMRDVLAAQDCLYTLELKHPSGEREARVIGSIVDYLYAPDDPEAVLAKLADPATKIVSLTVTEGGYHVDQVTGEFDDSAADIAHDIEHAARSNAPEPPQSAFGLIVEGLRRRFDVGVPPFTVSSCDNIAGNGAVAKKMLTAFTSRFDPALADRISGEVAFPNSMVDRITPVTTDDDRAQIAADFGVTDAWPVVCEPFTQWVIEDGFPLGRPHWEDVGVQIVGDVMPYELMKLRLLNSSHQALAYFGRLCDYVYAHDAAADPLFADFLLGYMNEEGTPTLLPVPGVDLDDYKQTLVRRFANPGIRDTIARLCADSSNRIPKWLVPVIRELLAAGRSVRFSAAIVASWARYAEGVDEHGAPIDVDDARRDPVMAAAARQQDNPTAFVEQRDLFGDLAEQKVFVEAYLWALNSLHEHGARATLETLMRQ
jgi:mannitol 2-dehydrogenase